MHACVCVCVYCMVKWEYYRCRYIRAMHRMAIRRDQVIHQTTHCTSADPVTVAVAIVQYRVITYLSQ